MVKREGQAQGFIWDWEQRIMRSELETKEW